ncbi:MAG: uroporphyrinogen decarboxylase family protein [Candidatus Eisenbacteria bacterium]
MTTPLSRRDRVMATVAGDAVDRPPMSFWGHFYDREQTAKDLADATLASRARYDWDFVKLNPRASYHGEGWGLSYRYDGDPLHKPVRSSFPVVDVSDLSKVQALPGDHGALGEQLEAIRLVRKGLPDDVLLIETVFSPLGILADLCEHTQATQRLMAEDKDAVVRALDAITRTFEDFVPRALHAGADGIYFATLEWATKDRGWSPEDYRAFASPFDLRVLAKARGAAFNVLHVCRPRNFLRALADYPVAAFSWATTDDGNLSLAEGQRAVPGAVIGGIGIEDALLAEADAPALAQLAEGFSQTAGRRWMVAPGCSILPTTPPERLESLREAVLSHA